MVQTETVPSLEETILQILENRNGSPQPDDNLTKKVHLEVPNFHGKLNPTEFCEWITTLKDYSEWTNFMSLYRLYRIGGTI